MPPDPQKNADQEVLGNSQLSILEKHNQEAKR